MKEKTKDRMITIGFIIALLVIGIPLVYTTFFFDEDKEEVIIFNITGITNSINASTLASLHFEFIKFCGGKDLSYSSNDKVKLCWEQCAMLGREDD